mmetsp:Transcript_470/g.1023  ORF Transcript_470/g.1023 Transcript_470/m.1023 type:complete len:238 (+) Transcript_470:1100-1813(+)
MEIGPRRCLPSPGQLSHALLRLLRRRCAAGTHHPSRYLVFRCWILESRSARFPHERDPVVLRLERYHCWIRGKPSLQGIQGTPVAGVHGRHRTFVPRNRLFRLFIIQHHSLVHAFGRIGSVPGHSDCCRNVVLRFRPSGLSRCLLWLQARIDRVPHHHIDHCAVHPTSSTFHAPLCGIHGRRCYSLCRRLRGTLLHHDLFVDGPVLLRLWLHPHCLFYSDHHLRRGHTSLGLQPALR